MTRINYAFCISTILFLTGCMEQKNPAISSYTNPVSKQDSGKTVSAAPAAPPFVLLEMFTSEGCSNCPAAYPVVDRLVKRYSSQGKNVYLMDYHVDYWNNRGWTDPYSRPEFSNRQRKYSRAFKSASLYTPQMIVNGQTEFVASDEMKEDNAIRSALKLDPDYRLTITLGNHSANDSIPVNYNISPVPLGSSLLVALVEHQVMTDVKAGENAGRTLTHYNVVRELKSLELNSNSGTVLVPPPHDGAGGTFSVIAFLQTPDNMHVIAADSKPIN